MKFKFIFCTLYIINLSIIAETFVIKNTIVEDHEDYLYILSEDLKFHFYKGLNLKCRYKNK